MAGWARFSLQHALLRASASDGHFRRVACRRRARLIRLLGLDRVRISASATAAQALQTTVDVAVIAGMGGADDRAAFLKSAKAGHAETPD